MRKERKTIIFGNGLGMALDPEAFTLDHAIGKAWDDEDSLDETCKMLIRQCLPSDAGDRPRGEDHLDMLHLSMSACEFLLQLGQAEIHWLSDNGRRFPKAVRRFIYRTAQSFHQHETCLPDEFLDPLIEFIAETKSHIATLNYDNLLYAPFVNRGICAGYEGALVDGFQNKTGFKPENMQRKRGRDFGYYMHLHGSPLFVDFGDKIVKLNQQAMMFELDDSSSHIVLTHIVHKTAVIGASKLLMAYWNYLVKSISESEEIMLFGYSGRDEHLNQVVKNLQNRRRVRIVEWSGAGEASDRENHWQKKFGSEINYILIPCVLDFVNWK